MNSLVNEKIKSKFKNLIQTNIANNSKIYFLFNRH